MRVSQWKLKFTVCVDKLEVQQKDNFFMKTNVLLRNIYKYMFFISTLSKMTTYTIQWNSSIVPNML